MFMLAALLTALKLHGAHFPWFLAVLPALLFDLFERRKSKMADTVISTQTNSAPAVPAPAVQSTSTPQLTIESRVANLEASVNTLISNTDSRLQKIEIAVEMFVQNEEKAISTKIGNAVSAVKTFFTKPYGIAAAFAVTFVGGMLVADKLILFLGRVL